MTDIVPAPWAIRICGAVVDVSDGPYGEPIPWQLCDLLEGHTGDCENIPGDTENDD
jgi:hypothetical protein